MAMQSQKSPSENHSRGLGASSRFGTTYKVDTNRRNVGFRVRVIRKSEKQA
jgi:hypothetical protein